MCGQVYDTAALRVGKLTALPTRQEAESPFSSESVWIHHNTQGSKLGVGRVSDAMDRTELEYAGTAGLC